jgi:hypothetical protein
MSDRHAAMPVVVQIRAAWRSGSGDVRYRYVWLRAKPYRVRVSFISLDDANAFRRIAGDADVSCHQGPCRLTGRPVCLLNPDVVCYMRNLEKVNIQA